MVSGKTGRSSAFGTDVRIRRDAAQGVMDACLVVVVTELPELSLEVGGMPERDVVEQFAPNRADQSFNERVRHRYQGYRLDDGDFQDAKIRLPAMELEERVVIGTQG